MNKKLDRLKQWAGERMGGEVKTAASDEFKSLEMEMDLRQNGMERLHRSMSTYVQTLSKRKEGDDREKMLPVDVLAQSMIAHGEEFESDSLFGNCLIMMGQGNEKIARVQDSYVASATETWLESLERSLAQMKEYQAAKRKLESRRLAYDATLTKMQKQKREDFRVEEELRSQRVKYEESSEEVYRRMADIQESEADSMADLGAFMDAELEYHDRCRDILMNLRQQWPAGRSLQKQRSRSHSTTAHSFRKEESPPPPLPAVERPTIRSRVNAVPVEEHRPVERVSSVPNGAFRLPTPDHLDRPKSSFHRTNTTPALSFEGPTTSERMGRTRSEQGGTPPALPRKRSTNPESTQDSDGQHSPERYSGYNDGVASPAGSAGSRIVSRSSSNNALSNVYNAGSARKQPPPPPPASRKKPPPPPPPMKRTGL